MLGIDELKTNLQRVKAVLGYKTGSRGLGVQARAAAEQWQRLRGVCGQICRRRSSCRGGCLPLCCCSRCLSPRPLWPPQDRLKQWLSGALEASHYTQESIDDKRASLHLFISRLKLIYVRVKGEEKRAQRPRGPRKPRKPRRGRRLAAAWRRRTTGGEGAGASDERTVRCWLCFKYQRGG